DARNFHAAAHEFREGARSQSPATRHDLVLCRKWENFCISVGSDDRWIFLRLFRSQGPASHRILSDGDRINNPGVAGAVLLATHRNSLGDHMSHRPAATSIPMRSWCRRPGSSETWRAVHLWD